MKREGLENASMTDDYFKDLMEEARRLWPDPGDAPEVPPEHVLRQYLRAPDSLDDDDLVAQIEESVNCRRALEFLRMESTDQPWRNLISSVKDTEVSRVDMEWIETVRAGTRPQPNPPSSTPGSVSEPEIGQIWTTKSRIEISRDHKIRYRHTFLPPRVVIVEGPFSFDSGDISDTFFRCIPLTPDLLWENRLADDEALVSLPAGEQAAAHLWLERPVSEDQLERCFGKLDTDQAGRLRQARTAFARNEPIPPELGGGRKLSLPDDADTLLERERLHEIASFLCATTDARREEAEWQAQLKALDEEIDDIIKRVPARQTSPGMVGNIIDELHPAAAMTLSRGAKKSPMLVRRPGESVANALDRAKKTKNTGKFFARLDSGPELKTDGSWWCRWELPESVGKLSPDAFFLLYEVKKGTRIGWGTVSGCYADIGKLDLDDPSARLIETNPENYLLVIVADA